MILKDSRSLQFSEFLCLSVYYMLFLFLHLFTKLLQREFYFSESFFGLSSGENPTKLRASLG